jgi:hypothetical protein
MMSRRQLAAILIMTMAPSLTLYAHSEQSHRSPMARLEAIFAAARPAKRVELNGNWVLVSWVTTQQFITGQNGPDHVLINGKGIRNAEAARQEKHPFSYKNPQQFYWRLRFRHVGNRVQIVSEGEWLRPDGDVEDVTFHANGDFEFEPDFGAEGDFTYKCRMESATRIACLFHRGGEGLEFRRITESFPAFDRKLR